MDLRKITQNIFISVRNICIFISVSHKGTNLKMVEYTYIHWFIMPQPTEGIMFSGCPSIRLSVCLTVRLSVRPSVHDACLLGQYLTKFVIIAISWNFRKICYLSKQRRVIPLQKGNHSTNLMVHIILSL